MRIAVLVPGFPRLSQTFVALQVAALCQLEDCEVELFSFDSEGQSEWLPEGTQVILGGLKAHHFDKKVRAVPKYKRYWHLLKNKPIFFLKYLLTSGRPLKVKTLVNEYFLLNGIQHSDIVLCQFATIGYHIAVYKKLGLIPEHLALCCAIRGYDISKQKNYLKIQWPVLFKYTDLFLPVCHNFVAKLKTLGCQKIIRVCPSPVNIKALKNNFIPKVTSTQIKLLSIGRLVEKKGFDIAIQACAQLSKAGLNFSYDIIGDGPEKSSLHNLVNELGLTTKITFYGSVPNKEVGAWYARADLFLAPCKTASDGDSEGIPNVLKEAMYMEVPVISTSHSGISELVEDGETGFICPEGDAEAFYIAINKAIARRSSWPEIGSSARAKIEKEYSPEYAIDKLLQAIDKITEITKS